MFKEIGKWRSMFSCCSRCKKNEDDEDEDEDDDNDDDDKRQTGQILIQAVVYAQMS